MQAVDPSPSPQCDPGLNDRNAWRLGLAHGAIGLDQPVNCKDSPHPNPTAVEGARHEPYH